jgi:hypothetical protein
MEATMYALVDTSGNIIRRADFGDAPPPKLLPEKGLRWVLDTHPTVDHTEASCAPVLPVTGDAVEYVVTPHADAELKERRNAARRAQIAAIEAGQHRALREAVLTGDTARLKKLDSAVAAIRSMFE